MLVMEKTETGVEGVVEAARRTLRAEAAAIGRAADLLDERFQRAVRLIVESGGTVIVSGIGKSGHVARKIAATFASTGTPAIFLHAAEAAHGDVGTCRPGDVALLISKSGATTELQTLVGLLRERRVSLISITGSMTSPLARAADVCLDGSVVGEADSHNLAPSCSTAVALALGDALAFASMEARQLTAEQLGANHPAGWTGRLFRTRVGEVMARGERVPRVSAGDGLPRVLDEITRCGLGCACVLSESGALEGLITDGDLRRALHRHVDQSTVRATDIMTREPVIVGPQASLFDATRLMEDRPSQISVLPVVEEGVCAGVIRLHDIYQAEKL